MKHNACMNGVEKQLHIMERQAKANNHVKWNQVIGCVHEKQTIVIQCLWPLADKFNPRLFDEWVHSFRSSSQIFLVSVILTGLAKFNSYQNYVIKIKSSFLENFSRVLIALPCPCYPSSINITKLLFFYFFILFQIKLYLKHIRCKNW